MADDRDRTELRDDLPEDVRHPNETGAPTRALAIGMGIAAILLIAIAVAVTVI